MANAKRDKKETKGTQGHGAHGPHDDEPHGHRPHDPPYYDPDYQRAPDHGHQPPDNPRYPDSRIYGDYASKKPPRYVPHPFEHTCFKPRKEDYKPPTTCEDHDGELCLRKESAHADCGRAESVPQCVHADQRHERARSAS